jgi:hypothetical protein
VDRKCGHSISNRNAMFQSALLLTPPKPARLGLRDTTKRREIPSSLWHLKRSRCFSINDRGTRRQGVVRRGLFPHNIPRIGFFI